MGDREKKRCNTCYSIYSQYSDSYEPGYTLDNLDYLILKTFFISEYKRNPYLRVSLFCNNQWHSSNQGLSPVRHT